MDGWDGKWVWMERAQIMPLFSLTPESRLHDAVSLEVWDGLCPLLCAVEWSGVRVSVPDFRREITKSDAEAQRALPGSCPQNAMHNAANPFGSQTHLAASANRLYAQTRPLPLQPTYPRLHPTTPSPHQTVRLRHTHSLSAHRLACGFVCEGKGREVRSRHRWHTVVQACASCRAAMYEIKTKAPHRVVLEQYRKI